MASQLGSSGTSVVDNNALVFQNPLFLHPSDGPSTLCIQEKLTGSQNYRSRRRTFEIWLSTKRKLGFIKGISIAKSMMFVGTAFEIWQQLEKRFALSNVSRKYKLNRETYDIVQQGHLISDYYTRMKCVWEKLDSMNELSTLVNITPEITAFLAAIHTQKEEQKLFYVKTACSLLQQEESQRDMFSSSLAGDSTALYSNSDTKDKCGICRYKWHPPEKCLEKVGYPTWQ
ncbi:cysteine-rich receptor-like protein kinase 8 [Tanacetum coccineum]|uniref:Cysteine-rich receptor-like protein kinase 8 n=1 Tax=Tanacetum coccineum TaxID=301880 RepID=A0ABQ4Z529_9ASTR